MMSFENYLNQYKRKFVSLSFTDETIKSLQTYCKENGFDLSTRYDGSKQAIQDFLFHTTIFYSDTYHNTDNVQVSVAPFQVHPQEIELFGKEKNIPVLKLKLDNNIMKIRELFDQEGFKDSWPEYKPHISLSYKFDGDVSKLKLPSFPIVVNKFTIKDGKND